MTPELARALRRLISDPENVWAWYEVAKAAGAGTLTQLEATVGLPFLQRYLPLAEGGLALRNDPFADAMLSVRRDLAEPLVEIPEPMPTNERSPLWALRPEVKRAEPAPRAAVRAAPKKVAGERKVLSD